VRRQLTSCTKATRGRGSAQFFPTVRDLRETGDDEDHAPRGIFSGKLRHIWFMCRRREAFSSIVLQAAKAKGFYTEPIRALTVGHGRRPEAHHLLLH